MTTIAGNLDPLGGFPHSSRLARLITLPPIETASERLEAALGPELAKFLVSALTADGQGRVGSSSP